MRKNKKSFLYFLTLGIVFMLHSCSEDLYEEESSKKSPTFKVYEKNFKEISTEKHFSSSFTKLGRATNPTNKIAMEQRYGFEIDESAPVKEVHANGYISYTLGIKNDSLNPALLKNLYYEVLENGEIWAYIVDYHLTSPLKASAHNSFELNYSKVDFTPIVYNANSESKVVLADGCIWSAVHYCSEAWTGNTSGPKHVATSQCNNAPYLSTEWVLDCPDDTGGGSTGGNTPPTFDDSDGVGAGTSPTTGGGLIVPSGCKKIFAQFTKHSVLKQALKDLANTASQSQENGISIFDTANTNSPNAIQNLPQIGGGSVDLPIPASPNKYYMVAHTHDAYGSDGLGTYSIFSWLDLAVLAQRIKEGVVDSPNLVFYLFTADETYYAITIDDAQGFADVFDLSTDPSGANSTNYFNSEKALELARIRDKFYGEPNETNKITKNSEKSQDLILFLKMMKDLKLNNEMSIYETDADLETFNKLSLKSEKIEKKPCL